MELTEADLANIGFGRITVVSPPPGGGTSGALTLPIGYPKPTLTSMTPTSAKVGDASFNLTVTGTGFSNASYILWGQQPLLTTTVVSFTQLRASVPASLLASGGVVKVTVFNPTPGGGTSDAIDFSLENPPPTLSAITPDSSLVGVGFTLTVIGTGFVNGSGVRWNGTARATTFVNSTRLTAVIPASDVVAAGTVTVAVLNPAPGGGTSAGLTLRVREPAPTIALLAPSTAQAGQTAFTLTVSGSNFSSASVIQWNGQPRTTQFVNSSTLTTTVDAADVASPGTAQVVVVNPGTSGSSRSAALPILQGTLTLGPPIVVALKNNHVVYDSTRNVFYASVPSTVATRGNTVTKIAADGSIIGSVTVGSEPGRMAISDDDEFLYVVLGGSPSVARVSLGTFTKDLEFQLGAPGFLGPLFGEDIEVLPGLAHSVAVSRRNACCSPRHEGVGIYDDGVLRTQTTQGHTGSDRISRAPNALRLYGYNNETTEFGFRRILVTPAGLQEEVVVGSLISGFGVDIEQDQGLVYSTNGTVVDPGTMTRVGSIPATGVVRPDVSLGRVHFLSGSQISTYHYAAFTSLGSFSNAALSGLNTLSRWGSDGLVAGGGESIVILRGTLVGP